MKNLLIILGLISFLCCNSSKTQTDTLNLNDYFWQIHEYETPKVLVFEADSSGVKSKVYYKMKKISPDKLEITRYMDDFSISGILVDLFKQDSVFLDDFTIYDASGTSSKVQIDNGLIFSFKSTNDILAMDCTYKINSNPPASMQYIDSWKIQKAIEKEVNGKTLPTFISSGTSKRYFMNPQTNQRDSFVVKMQIDYTKGIGITKMIQVLPWFTLSETYLETISMDEFKKLQ